MEKKGLSIEEHGLIQKELKTLAEGIEELKSAAREIEDLKAEFKAFKLFMGRAHPDFKKEFPSIVKKVSGKP